MSLYCTWNEVLETSPYAGLGFRTQINPGVLESRYKKHKCKFCGTIFEAYPEYQYKRLKNDGRGYIWFCSHHCLRAWEKPRNEKWDKIIKNCFTEMEYLEAQNALAPEDRDPAIGDVFKAMLNCENRLNTAILRKAKGFA